MKHFYLLFTLLVSTICLLSCSDEIDIDEQENMVTYKVYSNTPDEPITMNGAGCLNLVIKNKWEKTILTKEFFAQIDATCKDRNTLMTGEIYVNGKLKMRRETNSRLMMSIRIKGKGD